LQKIIWIGNSKLMLPTKNGSRVIGSGLEAKPYNYQLVLETFRKALKKGRTSLEPFYKATEGSSTRPIVTNTC
jgi:hypothetical protein